MRTTFEVNAYYDRCDITYTWFCALITLTRASPFRLTTDGRSRYSYCMLCGLKAELRNSLIFNMHYVMAQNGDEVMCCWICSFFCMFAPFNN